jgi:type VI secretion system secreted protein Hcp
MAADMFLKLEGPDVKGESGDAIHKDLIEILSFSWGVSNRGTAASGGGGGAGAADSQDLTVTKQTDKSSNVLMVACASGQHYTKATLYVRKAGGGPLDYLIIELSPSEKGAVFLSGYQISGSDGGGIPNESINLHFAAINMIYNQQAKAGTGAGPAPLGYDFMKKARL